MTQKFPEYFKYFLLSWFNLILFFDLSTSCKIFSSGFLPYIISQYTLCVSSILAILGEETVVIVFKVVSVSHTKQMKFYLDFHCSKPL